MNNLDLIQNYKILNLDNFIIQNLRSYKNEKSLYLKSVFNDIFTDTNSIEFAEMYDVFKVNMNSNFENNFIIENNKENKTYKDFKIAVSLSDYLNAIIMKSFVNSLSLNNILYRNSHFLSLFSLGRNNIDLLVQRKNYNLNLFDGFCLAKNKLYFGLYSFYSNIYSNVFRFNDYYIERFKVIINAVKSLLNDLNFNTLKSCNVAQCCILGFYFHKNEVLSFYNTDNKDNLINKIKSTDFKSWSYKTFIDIKNKNFIYKYFVSNINNENITQHTSTNFISLCTYSTGDREYTLPDIKFIKEINTAIFTDDEYFKDKNYLSKFTSNKNKLRSCYDDVLKLLSPLYFANEINNQKNITTYGIEIECFSLENAQETIIKDIEENYLKGRAICKSDGSIGNNGIEIVSVPMTYNYIKNTNLFFEFANQTKNLLGSFSRDTTGVHIHISRNTLSRLDILKIVSFINNTTNFNYLSKIAGRQFFNNHYCECTLKNYSISELNNFFDKRLINQNKYTAVNLTHKNTIELRIFKGNIRPDILSRYIEFTDALVNFVKNTDINKSTNYISFLEFVDNHELTYPFLFNFHHQDIILNSKKKFRSLQNGYKFLKLLDKKNIKFKPVKFEFVEIVKLPKVRKSRNQN